LVPSAKEAKEAKKGASDPGGVEPSFAFFAYFAQQLKIELRSEMASHSTSTILERALQALQEYERNLTERVPGTGLPFQVPIPSHTVAPGERILANQLPAEKDAAVSQIFRWIAVRGARQDGVWGAEEFLWRDYEAWSQQSKQAACPPELFRETLNRCFEREADGWRGIALALDVAASRYIM
jgi:hypothetical protein